MIKKLRYNNEYVYLTLGNESIDIYYPELNEFWEDIYKLFQISPIYIPNHIFVIIETIQYPHNFVELLKMFGVKEFWEYADDIDPSDLAELSIEYTDTHKYFQNPDFEDVFWETDSDIFDTFETIDNYHYADLKEALADYWPDYNILLKYVEQFEAIELIQEANNYQIIIGKTGVYLIPT